MFSFVCLTNSCGVDSHCFRNERVHILENLLIYCREIKFKHEASWGDSYQWEQTETCFRIFGKKVAYLKEKYGNKKNCKKIKA